MFSVLSAVNLSLEIGEEILVLDYNTTGRTGSGESTSTFRFFDYLDSLFI
jgi:hypothetical protein